MKKPYEITKLESTLKKAESLINRAMKEFKSHRRDAALFHKSDGKIDVVANGEKITTIELRDL